jgi:hypothetical protein
MWRITSGSLAGLPPFELARIAAWTRSMLPPAMTVSLARTAACRGVVTLMPGTTPP